MANKLKRVENSSVSPYNTKMDNNAALLGFVREFSLAKKADLMMPPQKKKTNWLPTLAGGAALLGGAYGADKVFNHGQGMAGLMNAFQPKPLPAIPTEAIRAAQTDAYYGGRPSESVPNALSNAVPSYSVTPNQAGFQAATKSLGDTAINTDMGLGAGIFAAPYASKLFPQSSAAVAGAVAKYAPNLGAGLNFASRKALPAAGAMYNGYQIGSNPLVGEGWSQPANETFEPEYKGHFIPKWMAGPVIAAMSPGNHVSIPNPAYVISQLKNRLGLQENNTSPEQINKVTGPIGMLSAANPIWGAVLSSLGKRQLDVSEGELANGALHSQYMQNISQGLMNATRMIQHNDPQKRQAADYIRAMLASHQSEINDPSNMWKDKYPTSYLLTQKAQQLAEKAY